MAFALLCLPKENREDVTTFYAFCRKIDDLADDPDLPMAEKIAGLERWHKIFEEEPAETTAFEDAVLGIRTKHNIDRAHFHDLIKGCEMDLKPQRFQTWEDLQQYTHRVASTVGLICLPLFGAKHPDSIAYAETLGHALQLTNILRDVGEDLDNGGRIYLPISDLERFGYTESDLVAKSYDQRFLAMMDYQAERARELFKQAAARVPKSDARYLLAAEIMRSLYKRLLDKMQADRFLVFEQRYRLTKARKVYTLLYHSVIARFS